MRKILKDGKGGEHKVDAYKMERFASAQRGTSPFHMDTFTERSVQDLASDAVTRSKESALAPAAGAAPKRQALFSNFESTAPSLASMYSGKSAERRSLFTEYKSEDIEPEIKFEEAVVRPVEAEKEAAKEEESPTAEFKTVSFEEEESSNVKLLESQKDVAEKNAEIALLNSKIAELGQEIEALNGRIAAFDVERAEMQSKFDEIPAIKSAAHMEGYEAARKDFEKAEKARYEGERADYMTAVEASLTEAGAEIKKIEELINEIDKDMPEIVLSYVKEIVGTERKLNDKIIINVVQNALKNLKDLKQIVFNVNAEDAQFIADRFPQYGISIDAAVSKGNVKVRTKIGEINLSIDGWMESLQKQIDEQLAQAKREQKEEGQSDISSPYSQGNE